MNSIWCDSTWIHRRVQTHGYSSVYQPTKYFQTVRESQTLRLLTKIFVW